jgi:hypothetical protein
LAVSKQNEKKKKKKHDASTNAMLPCNFQRAIPAVRGASVPHSVDLMINAMPLIEGHCDRSCVWKKAMERCLISLRFQATVGKIGKEKKQVTDWARCNESSKLVAVFERLRKQFEAMRRIDRSYVS